MTESSPFIEEVAAYVGFTPADAQLLRDLAPELKARSAAIVDHFYEAIAQNARAASVFTGGEAQIERQKHSLRQWLEEIVAGTYDSDYFERHSRVGRVHVRIDLDQRYMFGAMSIIRQGLHDALRTAKWSEEREQKGHSAIDKICDIELAIMLETYREAYVERMRTAQKLATIGQVAASIGHELRNPLAVIQSSIHVLGKRSPPEPSVVKHVERIKQQVLLSSEIIENLLELARDRSPERRAVDFSELARDAIASVPNRSDVQVALEVDPDMPTARLDGRQLRHVVVNLVTNAIQAVAAQGRDGRVMVRVSAVDDALVFVVEDNGAGFSEQTRSNLFEPLFTTRTTGIGLGLALSRRIVERHGGKISAENRAAGGASFSVRIPGAFTRAP
jgi:signal transduction histidine kinase